MSPRIPRPAERGQTLVIAVLLLMVALILVPYLVTKIQNEGRWTVKEERSTAAYHLAEAGQDRAIWQLVASTQSWMNAISGSPTAGYNGDVQYSDVAGGLYEISITSGPGTNEVTVLTKGRDSSKNELRSIKAVYSGSALQSGLVTQGTFGFNSSFYVYWGQVTSYSNITVAKGQTAFTGCNHGSPQGGASHYLYYPFKDAASSISPWKMNPTPPTADPTKNYQSYDKNLPTMPELDFNYYRALAQNSVVPIPKGPTGAVADGGRSAQWRGTGYFNGPGTMLTWQNYVVNCSTCVIFVENDDVNVGAGLGATGKGYMILNGFILFKGNLHEHSDGIYGYSLTPPSNAWQQFSAGTFTNPDSGTGDTAAVAEYPGDCGYQTTCASYVVPNSSHNYTGAALNGLASSNSIAGDPPPFDQCQNTGLAFRGFMYVNSFSCSAGQNTMSGQIFVGPGGTDIGTGGVTHVIYYDPTIAAGVHYVRPPLSRLSWNEQLTSWP